MIVHCVLSSPVESSSIGLLRDKCLPEAMGAPDCLNGKVLTGKHTDRAEAVVRVRKHTVWGKFPGHRLSLVPD